MLTTTAADTASVPAGALTGEPQWLALEPEPIYTVLHTPPAHAVTGHAALLLPSFGWDDECSYRRRRDWATQLAYAGITTARFDFPGRENSAGSPLAPKRVESWVNATVEVARWLRELSSCDHLTAIGIGMGGFIAYSAVAEDAPVDDLVLWGVRASGGAYVRELRAYASITAKGDETDDARTDGAIGIGGHVMSADTAASLSSIKLTELELPDAARRRVLLIERDAHGVDGRLRDALVASGADVTVLESDEYHALMSPPDLGLAPVQTVSASVDWIAAGAHRAPSALTKERRMLHPNTASAVTFKHDGTQIRERLTAVATAAGTLHGVISEPATGPRAPYCLVSVNSGALRHTGPNRLFVEIARRAAAHGVAAARFDLPGLGDSDGTAVGSFERTEVDDRKSLAAMRAIYDHLEQLGVAHSMIAAGFSLGGYLTVRVATSDERVRGALCVNPTGFVWTDKQRKRVLRDLVAMVGPDVLSRGRGQSPAPRAATGPLAARLAGVGRSVDARLRARLARSERLWRVEHRREIAGLNERLDELAGTGTQMYLLLSEDEPLLRMLGHSTSAARLARCTGITVEQIPNDDHLLRPLWVQELVADRFVTALLEFTSSNARAASEPTDQALS